MTEKATSDLLRETMRGLKIRILFYFAGIVTLFYFLLSDHRMSSEEIPEWFYTVYPIIGILALSYFILDNTRDYYVGKKMLRNLGYDE